MNSPASSAVRAGAPGPAGTNCGTNDTYRMMTFGLSRLLVMPIPNARRRDARAASSGLPAGPLVDGPAPGDGDPVGSPSTDRAAAWPGPAPTVASAGWGAGCATAWRGRVAHSVTPPM